MGWKGWKSRTASEGFEVVVQGSKFKDLGHVWDDGERTEEPAVPGGKIGSWPRSWLSPPPGPELPISPPASCHHVLSVFFCVFVFKKGTVTPFLEEENEAQRS